MTTPDAYRLPDSVTPRSYQLQLRPDIEGASFSGTVLIDVDVHEPVDEIVLNAAELQISGSTVTGSGGPIEVTSVVLDPDAERMALTLASTLPSGTASVQISFDGVLNDKLRGFYRSTFKDEDGRPTTIATTQFEATNARRCFPCWDEPAHKATFAVTLDVPNHLLAVSAMRETSRIPIDDRTDRVTFAPTPKMSTYLLAFVVGDLEASRTVDVDGVPLRIIHRPGRDDQTEFALDAAAFCLQWLTDYFDVPYFGDKLDLLAIPDFAFGAMENTGCVTFREVLLLIDPALTTQPEQQRAVAVIAHELAHMWFGNLVTMAWWEGLWLKEAFATFMETAATDAYRPEWRVWEGFATDRSAAFSVDCLHTTRPIEFEVTSPDEAEGMYDVLTYEKGASVVRMLEQFVGPEEFRDGLRDYMRTHAHSNTVTRDLWDAIERSTSLPVAEIMQEWIYQGGFPLIEATLTDDDVALEQRPFRLLERSTADDHEWKIPLDVAIGTGADASREQILMVPHGRIPMEDDQRAGDPPVIVDPDRSGFFRTHYDPELRSRLATRLPELTPGQRHALFDDAFELVLAGRSSMADYVSLCASISGEDSPPVWQSVTTGWSTMSHVAPDRQGAALVGARWASIATSELHRLGLGRDSGENDPLINEVRASLFTSLGSLSRLPDVLDHARDVFDGSIAADSPSMQRAVLQVIASTGDTNDYDQFLQRFQAAESAQLERRYLFALARFDDPAVIADVCERTLDGTIRSQDAGYVLALALGNRWHGPSVVWPFVTERWGAINKRLPDNTIGRLVSGVRWLVHQDLHQQVHAFLDANPIPQAQLIVDQHRERLDVHVGLAKRFGDEFPTD